MSAGLDSSAALSCAKALGAFVENGSSLLAMAKRESKEGSLEDFIRRGIRIERSQSLLGLIQAAAALYKSLSVKKRKDAEDLWGRGYRCTVLRDAVEDFLQLGVQWDAFLQRLDGELHLSHKSSDQDRARCVSADTPLTDARTGEAVTLGTYLGREEKTLLVLIRQFSCLLCRLHLKDLQANKSALEARSVRVLVVSFGCPEGASHWLEETGCQFDMLLDPQRKLYSMFGLEASLQKVLNFSNMLLYAEYVAADMEFPRDLPSIQDDMFQLGGDFILDEHGRVLFSHCCQSPLDRPSVEAILAAC